MCENSGIVLFEFLIQPFQLLGRQNLVLNKVVSEPVLLRALIQEDRIHLKDRKQSQLDRFFAEETRTAAQPENFINAL